MTKPSGVKFLLLLALCRTSHAFFPIHTRRGPTSTTSRTTMAALEIADQYTAMVANYPLVTASFTSGSLAGVGDAIAQLREGNIENFAIFDTERNQRFIVKGLGGGLIWLFWFRLADELTQRFLPMSSSSETLWLIAGTTLLSILLDQFLASPIVFALWDIPMPLLLSKEEKVDIPLHIESKLGGLLVENAKVWTLANAVIYNLPLEYRVLASSMTDLVWQSIVSNHVNADLVEADAA